MLEPYTVLDFTDERGELGAMLLGDLGADVIRVEPPNGSDARRCTPFMTEAAAGLESLSFLAFNRNKRSIVLDPQSDADRATLEELIRRADFLFESAPGRVLSGYGIGFEEARNINPRIVHVRISPFGDDGPHADYLGNDLVIAAMGGPVFLQGVAHRPPVRVSVPQVWRHAGAEAAAGALAAHAKMLRSGTAQFVDLSAQCVMTWTMLNAMDAKAIQGFDFSRGGVGLRVAVEIVHPTLDGFIVALPTSAVLRGCLEWMIAEGIADASLRDLDWVQYELNLADPDQKPLNLKQGTELLRRLFARHSKHALYEFGLANDITLAPVDTLSELVSLKHLKEREYWHPLRLDNGREVASAGIWAKTVGSGAGLAVRRRAPKLDEHGEEIRAELERPFTRPARPETSDALPFDGIKVADFSWVGVGPISSKYLADHGALVVKIESTKRPDVLRGGVPFKDAIPGLDRSQFFGDFNTSKRSITLDMKSPDALHIAKQLIAWSDVVIESFAAGAIARMGFGYEAVRALKPDIIMLSTCLMGQTGSAAQLAGYGYHAGAIAGFYEVTGWPDLPPSGPWVAYTDTIAPRFVSALLAAAIDHRRRTGKGCYIDLAQLEASLHFLAPEILDYQINGYEESRRGNRSRFHAPQGCYPCVGDDNWCAIAVDTDVQWVALCKCIGRDDWATSKRFATHADRLAAHDEIDGVISTWTEVRDAREVMAMLQTLGVPVGVVQRSSDLLQDPQYTHRGFYRYMDHPEMGTVPYAGHQYRIGTYDNGPRAPAPLLGQHSFEVLQEILGYSDEEIADAFASGAIT